MTLQEKEQLYFEFKQALSKHKYATALRIIGQMPEALAFGARKKMETSKALSRAIAEHSLEQANSYNDFPEDYGHEKCDALMEQMPLEPGFFTSLAGDGGLRDAALAVAKNGDDSIIVGLYGQDWRSLDPTILRDSTNRLKAMEIAQVEQEHGFERRRKERQRQNRARKAVV